MRPLSAPANTVTLLVLVLTIGPSAVGGYRTRYSSSRNNNNNNRGNSSLSVRTKSPRSQPSFGGLIPRNSELKRLPRPPFPRKRPGGLNPGRSSSDPEPLAPPYLQWLHNVTGVETSIVVSPTDGLEISINTPLTPLPTGPGPVDDPQWGYAPTNGPEAWPFAFPECSGIRQSPINIVTSRARFVDMPQMTTLNFRSRNSKFVVSYNGAALTLKPKTPVYLRGVGVIGETYTLANIHFHWSSSNHKAGSEHAFDGVKFPLEAHALCYLSRYGSMSAAKKAKDGLAGLAVIFDIGRENEAMWPIITARRRMRYAGQEVAITRFNPRKLFPDKLLPFYRYHGSITVPPCTQNVVWSVFRNVQTLSNRQYQLLQAYRRGRLAVRGYIPANSRPLQDDFSRPVITNSRGT